MDSDTHPSDRQRNQRGQQQCDAHEAELGQKLQEIHMDIGPPPFLQSRPILRRHMLGHPILVSPSAPSKPRLFQPNSHGGKHESGPAAQLQIEALGNRPIHSGRRFLQGNLPLKAFLAEPDCGRAEHGQSRQSQGGRINSSGGS